MATLTVTRGLPASGKSTYAAAWVAEDPATRARVNRDTLRLMLHDGVFIKGETEQSVVAARDAAIVSLLERGVDVINDDTNLPSRVVRGLRALADGVGADFEVVDMTDVPVDVCIRRDRDRESTVGEAVIRDHFERFVKGKPHPLPMPEPKAVAVPHTLSPYESDPSLPATILVDLDGTVALMNGRSPYDETRVGEDHPNAPVVAAVTAMANAGHKVLFLSARTQGCYDATAAWLDEHVPVEREGLLMREVGDQRKDALVKSEIFDEFIRPNYNVVAVFDDRRQVVDMWRSGGLTVFHVDEGDF